MHRIGTFSKFIRRRSVSADEWVGMQFAPNVASSIAVSRAQSLLRAWVCGDLNQLEAELDRSALAFDFSDAHPECERLGLLKSVACQMRTCPDLYAERSADPRLGLCVDLLVHLASCSVHSD